MSTTMRTKSPCLDSLLHDVEECYKRQKYLQRAEKKAWQVCEEETKLLKQKADWLDITLQEEIGRLHTLLKEALSATQENAAARGEWIQCEVSAVIAQADLDIAKTRMTLPGRPWSGELMAARYYALNGDAMKDARSRYLDAYEGAIREHEASLMAEDMELVALYLSWRTERVTSTRSCKLNLDEKWAQRISLCRLRAAPVRAAYEASKRSCKDDLHNGYATAASELSSRRKARFRKGDELDADVQTLVDTIIHRRDEELAKLEVKITGIEEEHRRQAKKLRDDYKSQVSSLKESVRLLVQPLLSAIKKHQEVFAREQEVISKDLRAVQATLTLMTSAIQTLDQDPNFLPYTHTPRRPSTRYGTELCPCGCGHRGGPTHRDQGSGKFFNRFNAYINAVLEQQQRADESRRQREVDEDRRRRDEERLTREREEQLRKEEAEAHVRAERKARERFEREQEKRRQEEETKKREEARRKWEDEERRKAEAERRAREEEGRRAREEEESRQREEETARKRAEEEKRRREDARRREEEEYRQREEDRSNQQNRQDQQHSSDCGGEDAQSATGGDDINDGDNHARGTENPSTAKGRAKFVRKCWNKYTEAWSRLMASDVSRLPFQDIPWPILPPRKRRFTKMTITDILSRINKESIQTFILDPEHLQSLSPRARIRKELLRFHPDKRIQWLKNVKDEEKGQVDETCKQVVLHLTDLLNTAA